MHRPGQHQRAVVVHGGQSETAVLLGDLDPERAERLQAVDHVVADVCLALDPVAVDLPLAELAQALEKPFTLGREGGFGLRQRVEQVEPEPAEEQLLGEARPVPPVLPRFFGGLASLIGVHLPRGIHARTSGIRGFPTSLSPTRARRYRRTGRRSATRPRSLRRHP